MGLFHFFSGKARAAKKPAGVSTSHDSSQPVSLQDIVRMAQAHEPENIYCSRPDGQHLAPEVQRVVGRMLPRYVEGHTNLSAALMLENPSALQKRMQEANVDTLLVFFKFLAIKAGETSDNPTIGVVQQYLISVLRKKLA